MCGFAVYIDLYCTLPLGHNLHLVSRNGMFGPSSETGGISIINWICWFMEFRLQYPRLLEACVLKIEKRLHGIDSCTFIPLFW